MEEDTDCFCYADTDELAAVKYGGGQAAAYGSSSREKTGPTPARGLQAYGPEITGETTRPDCYETSACADCATTGRSQAWWFSSWSDRPSSSCKAPFCSFCNTKAKLIPLAC